MSFSAQYENDSFEIVLHFEQFPLSNLQDQNQIKTSCSKRFCGINLIENGFCQIIWTYYQILRGR